MTMDLNSYGKKKLKVEWEVDPIYNVFQKCRHGG